MMMMMMMMRSSCTSIRKELMQDVARVGIELCQLNQTFLPGLECRRYTVRTGRLF